MFFIKQYKVMFKSLYIVFFREKLLKRFYDDEIKPSLIVITR